VNSISCFKPYISKFLFGDFIAVENECEAYILRVTGSMCEYMAKESIPMAFLEVPVF
jgi:hypothetical protein